VLSVGDGRWKITKRPPVPVARAVLPEEDVVHIP